MESTRKHTKSFLISFNASAWYARATCSPRLVSGNPNRLLIFFVLIILSSSGSPTDPTVSNTPTHLSKNQFSPLSHRKGEALTLRRTLALLIWHILCRQQTCDDSRVWASHPDPLSLEWYELKVKLRHRGACLYVPLGSAVLPRFWSQMKISAKWSISLRSRIPISPLR